jgi:3-methyladenine DNA glycosylase AlkD
MTDLNQLLLDVKQLADPEKAKLYGRFFKTAPGQYGAGDKFLGLNVPSQHLISKKYNRLSLSHIHELLASVYHEHRVIGLMILLLQFTKATPKDRKTFFDFYLAHTVKVNNWDLVDISAPTLVGDYLQDRDKAVLYRLAISNTVWERRIAIISTLTFIRHGQYMDTLEISKMLLADRHDLIHKAVGWMLREVGKRDLSALTTFLDHHFSRMPRTSLRYAIEKFPPSLRAHYLALR